MMSSHAFKQSKTNTGSNNQSEQTYGILQGLINVTGKNKRKMSSTGKVNYGMKTNIKIELFFGKRTLVFQESSTFL